MSCINLERYTYGSDANPQISGQSFEPVDAASSRLPQSPDTIPSSTISYSRGDMAAKAFTVSMGALNIALLGASIAWSMEEPKVEDQTTRDGVNYTLLGISFATDPVGTAIGFVFIYSLTLAIQRAATAGSNPSLSFLFPEIGGFFGQIAGALRDLRVGGRIFSTNYYYASSSGDFYIKKISSNNSFTFVDKITINGTMIERSTPCILKNGIVMSTNVFYYLSLDLSDDGTVSSISVLSRKNNKVVSVITPIAPPTGYTFTDGMEVTPYLNDLWSGQIGTPQDCANACNGHPLCDSFVIYPSEGRCHLKSVSSPLTTNAGATTYVRNVL